MRTITALLLIVAAAGCAGTLPRDWVATERKAYDAIGNEYLEYVAADESLDLDDKTRRQRSVDLWREEIDTHERLLNAGGGQ